MGGRVGACMQVLWVGALLDFCAGRVMHVPGWPRYCECCWSLGACAWSHFVCRLCWSDLRQVVCIPSAFSAILSTAVHLTRQSLRYSACLPKPYDLFVAKVDITHASISSRPVSALVVRTLCCSWPWSTTIRLSIAQTETATPISSIR